MIGFSGVKMKLVPNKIYRCIPYLASPAFPTLFISGAMTVYVSLNGTEPKSIANMDDVTNEIKEGYNTLTGQIRYICVVGDAPNYAEECGIVSTADYRGK